MALGDIFELNVDMLFEGQNCVNVHHVIQTSTDGTGTWQVALLGIWTANMEANLLACMVDQVEIVQVRMRRLFPTQTQQTITPRASFGSIAADPLPPHACALIRQRGIPTGRKGTGGVKIIGVPRTLVFDGRITTGYAAILETYAGPMEQDFVHGSGYEFHYGVLSQVDDSFRAIEKIRATPRIVTVRSRQIGVGQ